MKSEHRHELKTNELGRIASDWGRASERYVQQHTYQIVAAVVLVIAAAIGVVYWRNASEGVDRRGWRDLLGAGSSADFGNVADKYRGTQVGAWARLREAEGELYTGVRLLFSDRDAGRSELKKAQENFEKLKDDKLTPPDVLERALFGLARCREALPAEKNVTPSKIDDPAIGLYERLLSQFPETVFKEAAEARIAALRTGSAQDFYAWFAAQNPKRADRELPKDLAIPPLPDSLGGKTSSNDDKAGEGSVDGKKSGPAQKDDQAKKSSAAKTGEGAAAASKTATAQPTKPSAKPAAGGPAASGPLLQQDSAK